MARITKQVEERRQEIVDAARKHFIESGFEKTAIGDIAKELNIAHGLIYHYFKSKTDLLYAVVDQIATEQLDKTYALIEAHDGSALDCLHILFNQEKDFDQFSKLFEALIEDPGVMNYVNGKLFYSVTPVLAQLIARGNEDGSWDCDDPEMAAVFILQGAKGIMGLHCEHPDKEKNGMSLILRVLGARTNN
ncbi:MAG: TetR/AcrR family transcriptional regulator [Clostridiales Family XIII bacterium]|jgi:AcrR family transcriptional regulator|nr:TetR/AcrR family transcriptional regulator [Clostridiales Family XIII bacterium]